MKIAIDLPDVREITREIETSISRASTESMRATTYETLLELRRSTTEAGLSQRLANTWRDRVYPERRASMTPTGYIWSNAPQIIDSLSRGVSIVPRNGQSFLAIPTDKVPTIRRRIFDDGPKRGGKMTPAEVEHTFNQNLFFKRGRGGTVLAFINVVRAKNRRGFRAPTTARLNKGRALEQILMFVLVPSVRMPKIFDLEQAANAWADRYTANFMRRLEA